MIEAARTYPQLPADTEIHAYELVNSKGAWEPMREMRRAALGSSRMS
jgi:hypothetical protein